MFQPALVRSRPRDATFRQVVDPTVAQADDVALMAAVVEHADRQAFALLFRRYAPR